MMADEVERVARKGSQMHTYRLCGGPLDGEIRTVDGHVLKVSERPPSPILSEAEMAMEPMEVRTGTYSTRPELVNALQWDGWDQ